MESLLETEGYDAKTLSWAQLGSEAELGCSGRTIQKALNRLDNHKCISCKKRFLDDKHKRKRVEWVRTMLERYPLSDDWKRVRFSDECYFGYGPQRKLRIIRKRRQRYCPSCIQGDDPKGQPSQKDQKRIHVWGAIGWNFKSDLVFYTVPGNSNGKMTHSVYLSSILEPVVGQWIKDAKNGSGPEFVLEEDGDSGHGGGQTGNPVRKWKEEHGLISYFKYPSSPDLSPIENAWQIPKQYTLQISSLGRF